jgi:hypothetical protein
MKINRATAVLNGNRWAKYVTAGAAGVSVGFCAQTSVDADLTVVNVNAVLEDRTQGNAMFDYFGPYTFDAPGASFRFEQAFNEAVTSQGQLAVRGMGNLSIAGFQANGYLYPLNLAYGQNISTQVFGVPAGERGTMAWGSGNGNSQWLSPGTGFLGFRFDLGGGTRYGWAQVQVNGAPDNRGVFLRYGYGMLGDSVFAGEGIPEPGALGCLALGSIGLLAWRHKRAARPGSAKI